MNDTDTKSRFLKNILIENADILLQNSTVSLSNCTFINVNLIVFGNLTNLLSIYNTRVKNSTITLESVRYSNIEYCQFIAGPVHEVRNSQYMLKVIDTDYLSIKSSSFGCLESIFNNTGNKRNSTQFINNIIEDYNNVSINKSMECKRTQLGLYIESVTLGEIFNSTFIDIVSASDNGSAVYCKTSNLTIDLSQFHRNEAKNGIIWIASSSNITIRNTSFKNNQAQMHGGAIAVEGHSNIRNLDCVFKQNAAKMQGAAIYAKSVVFIENIRCLFQKNTCNDPNYYKSGGVLYLEDGVTYLNNDSIFKYGTAKYGGAVFLRRAVLYNLNCIFFENHASSWGGAINAESGQCFNEKSIFNHNSAFYGGGALEYYRGGNYTNIESMFINNKCNLFIIFKSHVGNFCKYHDLSLVTLG